MDINTKLSKNFTLSELIASDTAKVYKIDNTPGDRELENLKNLCTKVLQPIRDKWGKPIKVNSGYRSPRLNRMVNGSSTSDHLVGAAADIKVTSGTNRQLFDLILGMIRRGEIECRQLIWEYGSRQCPNWVHIAVNNPQHKYKKNQIVYYFNK